MPLISRLILAVSFEHVAITIESLSLQRDGLLTVSIAKIAASMLSNELVSRIM